MCCATYLRCNLCTCKEITMSMPDNIVDLAIFSDLEYSNSRFGHVQGKRDVRLVIVGFGAGNY
jgi:hypothetical protein